MVLISNAPAPFANAWIPYRNYVSGLGLNPLQLPENEDWIESYQPDRFPSSLLHLVIDDMAESFRVNGDIFVGLNGHEGKPLHRGAFNTCHDFIFFLNKMNLCVYPKDHSRRSYTSQPSPKRTTTYLLIECIISCATRMLSLLLTENLVLRGVAILALSGFSNFLSCRGRCPGIERCVLWFLLTKVQTPRRSIGFQLVIPD